jgi:glutamine amidotransferase
VIRIAVIDHGAGNLVSMEQALEDVGATAVRIDEGQDLAPFDGVVLPGVGATGAAMRTLRRRRLVGPLRTYPGPLLGVCVGLQLLFERSDEDDTTCLGLLPGSVRRIRASTLPHMGWNTIEEVSDPLLPATGSPTFYFVHSYVAEPVDRAIVTGWTTHDTDRFPASVRRGRIAGLQFHPERSGPAGIAVLERFVDECKDHRRAA